MSLREDRIPLISIHPESATLAEIADLAAELMEARRDRMELLEALARLLDEQNGAPLIRRAEQWQSAVDAGYAALALGGGR